MARPILASLASAILLAAKVQGSGEALVLAARRRDISTARNLIDAGADVNVAAPQYVMPESDWWSPLMYAAAHRDMVMFNLLITAGADVNYQNDDGETALFRVVEHPHSSGVEDMVQALIQAGADVNAKYPTTRDYRSGYTPLMLAIFFGHNGVSQLLIDAGSDLSYQNPEGETALQMATIYDSVDTAELVKSLVDAGADVNVSAEWYKMAFTPLMHAAMNKDKEVCKILIGAGADTGNISLGTGWEYTEQEINEFLTRLEQE